LSQNEEAITASSSGRTTAAKRRQLLLSPLSRITPAFQPIRATGATVEIKKATRTGGSIGL